MSMAESTEHSASDPGVSGGPRYVIDHRDVLDLDAIAALYTVTSDAIEFVNHDAVMEAASWVPALVADAHELVRLREEAWQRRRAGLAAVYRELAQLRGELESAREMAEAWRTAAGKTGPIEADHPESMCQRCGGENVEWSAPSPLWNEVIRGGSINGVEEWGVVCPTCFAVLAQERGIAAGNWRLSVSRVLVPLETVTPSGRIWNERTWMFDEPDKAPPGAAERDFAAIPWPLTPRGARP